MARSRAAPNLTDPDVIQGLLARAFAVCKKLHHPIYDDEYNSAVHFAVFDVIQRAKKRKTPHSDVVRLAIQASVNACLHTRDKADRWTKLKYVAAASRREAIPAHVPSDTGEVNGEAGMLASEDRDILVFVATHGRLKAARLLGMTKFELKKLLDEIENAYCQGV